MRRSKRKRGKKSMLEEALLRQIRKAGIPDPERQYRFHATRRWRADFAWKRERVLVEVEGGIWMQTKTGRSKGHAHPVRFEADCMKYNEAEISGWHVIRVTEGMIDSGMATDQIRRELEARREQNGRGE